MGVKLHAEVITINSPRRETSHESSVTHYLRADEAGALLVVVRPPG